MPKIRDVETIEKEIKDVEGIEKPDKEKIESLKDELDTRKEINKEIEEKSIVKASDGIKVEKDKIYDTQEKLKGDLRDKDVRLKELEEKQNKINQEKVEKEKVEKIAKEKEENEKLEVSERISKIEADSRLEKEKMDLAFKKKDQEMKSELQKRDLNLYKQSLIATAKGQIIPELVEGNSEEEIKKSFENAVQRYKSIVENNEVKVKEDKIKQSKLPEASGDGKIESDSPPAGNDANSSGFKELSAKEIAKLTPDQFKKHKEEALAHVDKETAQA